MTPLPESPRSALGAFILEIDDEYYPWYEKSVGQLRRTTLPLQTIALVAGFGASVLTAIFTGGSEPIHGFIRLLLIVLPALSSALTTFVVQAKLLERYQLRENGRLALQSLSNEAKQRYAVCTTDNDFVVLHASLRSRVDEIEAKQSDSFFGLLGSGK